MIEREATPTWLCWVMMRMMGDSDCDSFTSLDLEMRRVLQVIIPNSDDEFIQEFDRVREQTQKDIYTLLLWGQFLVDIVILNQKRMSLMKIWKIILTMYLRRLFIYALWLVVG